MIRILVLGALTLHMVVAEPPISNTYGPPSRSAAVDIPSLASRSALASQHGDPASVIIRYNGGSRSGASARNGGSASSRLAPPSVPASTYGAPSNSYSAPSTSYSAPSVTSARFSNGGASSNSFSARQNAPSQFSAPSPRYGAPAPVYGPPSARNSLEEDPLAEPAHYEFTYEVQDPESGSEFSAQESRQDESAKGSYSVLLPDGVLQVVQYEADQEGFRPTITYEDTGKIPSGKSSQGPYPASGVPQGPY